MRVTAFITDTGHGVVPGQLGGLELRHRQHARVEDRIRQAKATGLRNLPCHNNQASQPASTKLSSGRNPPREKLRLVIKDEG